MTKPELDELLDARDADAQNLLNAIFFYVGNLRDGDPAEVPMALMERYHDSERAAEKAINAAPPEFRSADVVENPAHLRKALREAEARLVKLGK